MDFTDLQDRLLFAVPKKGRLNEQVLKLLEGADIKYARSTRYVVSYSMRIYELNDGEFRAERVLCLLDEGSYYSLDEG
jgi:ATP phosphoribosyltransferase